MENICLSDLLQNKSVYFREDFNKVRKIMENNKDSIYSLDFKGIEVLSPSSAHELLCLLNENSNLKINNLNEKILKIIKSQIRLRNIKINLEDYSYKHTHQVLA
ncbi:MAG: hypothetical protein KC589_10870 [Nanoarchaeota archaeon]|nr:hypothetical protein [Nanoarchaeota archaeon]